MNIQPNLIKDLTFEFSLMIIDFTTKLQESRHFSLANQLFKSGTSIGANVREAQNSESKPDFIHKMKIAAKEASETEYWLMLCNESPHLPECILLLEKIESIQKVISKIIATTKKSI